MGVHSLHIREWASRLKVYRGKPIAVAPSISIPFNQLVLFCLFVIRASLQCEMCASIHPSQLKAAGGVPAQGEKPAEEGQQGVAGLEEGFLRMEFPQQADCGVTLSSNNK